MVVLFVYSIKITKKGWLLQMESALILSDLKIFLADSNNYLYVLISICYRGLLYVQTAPPRGASGEGDILSPHVALRAYTVFLTDRASPRLFVYVTSSVPDTVRLFRLVWLVRQVRLVFKAPRWRTFFSIGHGPHLPEVRAGRVISWHRMAYYVLVQCRNDVINRLFLPRLHGSFI